LTKALRIHSTGGPEVFVWEEVVLDPPGPKEARLRHSAIGVNYVDTYHRAGVPHPWPLPPLPAVIGFEGVGVVEAVGSEVTEVAPGARVAYALPPLGAYAQARNMPARQLIAVPDEIDDVQAAGMMLKGLTAQYLLRQTYRVQAGDTVLIHAAAGGMGLILCQWAKHLGATVIGTVGSDAKAEQARAHGCDHPVVYTREDFLPKVRELTGGKGVPVVYESVGKDTFARSLDCLRPLGLLASFGHASGPPPPPVDVIELGAKGALSVIRPTIMAYMARRKDRLASAAELFEVVLSGVVKIEVNQTYPLKDGAEAHRAIGERRTTGSTVLIPDG
jgi:NADPH2:quinone reductase